MPGPFGAEVVLRKIERNQRPLGLEQFSRHECCQELHSNGAQLLFAEVCFSHGGVDGDGISFSSAAYPQNPLLIAAAKSQLGQRPAGIEMFRMPASVQRLHAQIHGTVRE